MPLSDQAVKWQAHLDKLFPRGVMVVWDGEAGEGWYAAARVNVDQMDGLDPVIRIPCFNITKVVGPYRLVSLDKTDQYAGDCYIADLEGATRKLVMKADVADRLARLMAGTRQHFIADDKLKEEPGEGPGPQE